MSQQLVWGNLLHLSQNMWTDRDGPGIYWPMRDHLLFDKNMWDELTEQMARVGMNMLVIDLGDGVLKAPWKPTTPEWRDHHFNAIQFVAEAIQSWQI